MKHTTHLWLLLVTLLFTPVLVAMTMPADLSHDSYVASSPLQATAPSPLAVAQPLTVIDRTSKPLRKRNMLAAVLSGNAFSEVTPAGCCYCLRTPRVNYSVEPYVSVKTDQRWLLPQPES